MHRPYLLILVVLVSCQLTREKFEDQIHLLDKVNSEIILKDSTPGERDLGELKEMLDEKEIAILFGDLMLNQVVVYSIGGVAYRFGSQT